MIDITFFKTFFHDYMVNLKEHGKETVMAESLFFETPIQKFQNYVRTELFTEFMDFTNENMDKAGNVHTDFIEYKVSINTRRFGRVYNTIQFSKMNKEIVDHLNRDVLLRKKMEDIKMDILGFATSAPVSARSLRFSIYKDYLRKVPVTYIENFLDEMVSQKLLKKKGVQYILP